MGREQQAVTHLAAELRSAEQRHASDVLLASLGLTLTTRTLRSAYQDPSLGLGLGPFLGLSLSPKPEQKPCAADGEHRPRQLTG